MTYDLGQPYIEITFPTRSVKVALFKREDIRRVKETVNVDDGRPLITIYVVNMTDDKVSEWYFDGTMEEFKQATKTVYL